MARIVELVDASDPRIGSYADLRRNAEKGTRTDWFVVEGQWCVRRLIESTHDVISVLVQRGRETEVASWLANDTPLYSLPSDQISRLVGFDFHRGMLACGRRPELRSVDELKFRDDSPRMALAPLGVSERENLGNLMRTAAAMGIDNLLIGSRTADPFSRRAIRVSMATVLKQQLYRLDQPELQLHQLQQSRNLRTIVATLDPAATPLNQFEADERGMILVVGNEAVGVDRAVEQIASDRVTIPMQLGTDSMNVAVAAAIFLYELRRRCGEAG